MKFRFSKDFVIDSDVEPWRREGLRIAMLGGPGSGKSWNNSLIAEQFLTQGGTVVIFQPRDEYFTLKEKFDVLSVGGVHAKDMDFALTSPSVYAKAVVEDGISMIFYTSAVEDEEKLINWVSRFIRHVLNYQERHKRPLLLILEDAEEYTPRTSSGHVAPPWVYNRMIKAFKDCFTQGRKLNIIAIASSQRPQQLNFTIRQLANLTFYGKFAAQDITYIDKECLKYVRKRIELIGDEVILKLIDASRLVDLKLGEWLMIRGRDTGFVTVTEPRLTKHGAETPRLEYVAPRTTQVKKTIDQLTKSILEALKKEEAEKSELEKAKRKISGLTNKLEAAEEKARIKLSLKEILEGSSASEATAKLAEDLANARTQITKLKKEKADVEKTYGKAVELVSELKEKLGAFEYFEEALLGLLQPRLIKLLKVLKQPDPSGPASEIGLQATTTIVDVEPAIKHVTINDETMQGKVLTVAKKGKLDNWTKLGDIVKAVREEKWNATSQQVNNTLNDLVKQQLVAKKHTDRNYFCLAKNVKIKA